MTLNRNEQTDGPFPIPIITQRIHTPRSESYCMTALIGWISLQLVVTHLLLSDHYLDDELSNCLIQP